MYVFLILSVFLYLNIQSGETPLFWAARRCYLPECKILVEAGADVRITNNEGKKPIDAIKYPNSGNGKEVYEYLNKVEEEMVGVGMMFKRAQIGDDGDEEEDNDHEEQKETGDGENCDIKNNPFQRVSNSNKVAYDENR